MSSLKVCSKATDSDLSLVQEFKSGRTMAFDRLYERHATRIYNTCLSMMGNPEDARDAMQETFVQMYRSLPKFLEQSKFSTWLYRIAVNKCLDALRRRPKCESTDCMDSVVESPAHISDGIKEEAIRGIVSQLPADYRTVIVLHYFELLSCQEIADIMGLNADQVRIRLHRARKAFRRLYEESENV